jgi:hypothetical protein
VRHEEDSRLTRKQVFRDGPSNSNTVFIARGATKLVEQDQRVARCARTDEGRLPHFEHEGRDVVLLIVSIADSGTQSVEQWDGRLLRGYIASNMR